MAVNQVIVDRALAAIRGVLEGEGQPQSASQTAPEVQPGELPARSPQCPGPELCAGCYSIGAIDGRERFIHPPKASPEWKAWLERWQPKGKTQ